jgi:GH15 family glucan-1,4-alpha-glucosidase
LSLTIVVNDGDSSGALEQPAVALQKESSPHHLGDGVTARFRLLEGQSVTFILHDSQDTQPSAITTAVIDEVQKTTHKFWFRWIAQSKYHGRWESVVTRSLFILKLLTYEPTGAIVAAPTFSLPEDFGGKCPCVTVLDQRFSTLCYP